MGGQDANAHKRNGGRFRVADAVAMELPPGGSGSRTKGQNRNHPGSGSVPERSGTSDPFEPLSAFLERASKLPARTWLIPDLVPDSGRLFIVAAPNAGKTFLAMLAAKAAAAADRPAILVLEEGGVKATADRFRNLGFAASAPVHVAHLRGMELEREEVRNRLIGLLKAHAAPLLVLDPFVSIFMGDENDTREVNLAKAYLDELVAANPRALLVLCHHTSKAGERSEGPGMYAARGSSILSGWADVQLNLKHESVPKGSGQVAFVATVEKDREGERGHRVLVTVALGSGEVTYAEPKQRDDDAKTNAIIEAASSGLALSKNALAKQVGGNRERTLKLIDKLEGGGRLTKTAAGYAVASPIPADPEDAA